MKFKIRKYEGGGSVAASDLVDPEETFFGDDNSTPPLGAGAADDQDDPPAGGNDPLEDPIDPNANPGDDNAGEDDPVNHADYVFRSLGIESRQVDLGNGVVKNVEDLSETEQLEVVTSQLENVVSFYQERLAEIQQNGAFSNEVEQILIETLRQNKHDLSTLAKVIADNDPVTLAKTSSNEDIVRNHLKTVYPNFSDEDIDEQLTEMAGTSRFERLASQLREDLMKKPLEGGDLSKAIQKLNQDAFTKATNDFQKETTEIVNYVNSVNDLNGVPLTPEIKNFLLAELKAEAPDKDSKFIESLNSPERLLRLAYLDKFHDQILEQVGEYYFQKGLEESKKVTGKFNSTPTVIPTTSRFGKKNQDPAPAKKQEEEF